MNEVELKPKKLSSTNTKKEMLDAYNDLVKKISEQDQLQLKPQKITEEKIKKEVVEKVQGISTDSITKDVSLLKTDINSILMQLQENLEKEVRKYEDIQKAITAKETELMEIYEIEKSAFTLAALIESQNFKKQEFEDEINNKKQTIQKEMEILKTQWENEKKGHELSTIERDELEKKKKAREKEEYDYSFKRDKQISIDKLTDELSKKEKEFNEKFESKLKELDEREKIVKDKEIESSEFASKLSKFQSDIKEAVNKAVEENTQKLNTDSKNRIDFLTKEFEGEKKVLTVQIESLEKIVVEQSKQNNELTQKLDKAYQKVQDVAIKAIESSSSSKLFSELQNAFLDKASSKNKE
ncbi:MAG: hypothetical protein KKG93_17295 [Bacteroidetes bacterium]|nr:hypothetical protein [Bacteroidota bacterium]